jgi:hypothetical protein
MQSNCIDRGKKENCGSVTRREIYGTIQCSKHHKISKDRLFFMGKAKTKEKKQA